MRQNGGMTVLCLPSFLRLWSGRRAAVASCAADTHWKRDPLSHPDIRRMPERDRADLPFDPHRLDAE
jgi:hypothetical protein